jgi:hypothetical protein
MLASWGAYKHRGIVYILTVEEGAVITVVTVLAALIDVVSDSMPTQALTPGLAVNALIVANRKPSTLFTCIHNSS